MKLTLIKPNIGRMKQGPYVDEAPLEPLELAILAGLTPLDVQCVLYDDRIEPIPYDEETDLVAITVEIYNARRAYEIAGRYRLRGVPVILGGFHPTLVPEEGLAHADSVFIGDAEAEWSRVLDDARLGRLQRIYRAGEGAVQAGGLLPRRDVFRGKGYLPVTLMQFGRGCRFACSFCAVSAYFGQKHHVRPISEVLEEIESQERRFVFFVDDNLLSNHELAKPFLRELIPLRIRWVSQASLDMTSDPELMELLEASGCMGNVIGFESVNPESLRSMDKSPNLSAGHWEGFEARCEILRRHHLQTWAAFTLGHDEDTVESIEATLDFATRQKFCFAAFNILTPYPGTPLYDRLEREGRLLWDGRWWLHPDYRFNHAAFRPARMTPDELTEACWQCRRKWNTSWSIFKRMWDFKTHMRSPSRLAAYLAYNPLYAKEAIKKQGLLLGSAQE